MLANECQGERCRHSDRTGADRLKVSSFLQFVRGRNEAVAWHSLFGFPSILSNDALEFLLRFDGGGDQSALVARDPYAVREFRRNYFLVPTDLDERALLADVRSDQEGELESGGRVEFLELIMSEDCNFRCTYCIHFNNLEISERLSAGVRLMPVDLGIKAIDSYLQLLRRHGKTRATINFGGGEPLLAWERILCLLQYCQEEHGKEFNFNFLLNTNASLITRDIARQLKRFDVSIATSLDGLESANDRVRRYRSGRGTFSQILGGLQALSSVGYPVSGVAMTVTADNFEDIDERVIDWAKEEGMSEIRIDIDVVGMVDIPVAQVADRLMNLRLYGADRGIEVPGFWSRPAENLGFSALTSPVAFCGGVRGNSLCVSPAAAVYPCGYSNTRLMSVDDLTSFRDSSDSYSTLVRSRRVGALEMCKGCMIEGQCSGGCLITQEFAEATRNGKRERMCELYRVMTVKILKDLLEVSGTARQS